MTTSPQNKILVSETKQISSQPQPPNTKLRTIVTCYVSPLVNTVNVIVLITMTIMVKAFPTTRRGFYCDDTSIRYPKLPETVSTNILIVSTVVFSLAVFTAGEFLASKFHHNKENRATQICQKSSKSVKEWMARLRRSTGDAWYFQVPKLFFILLWGIGVGHVICYVLKSSFGYLRPNFFQVCQPNVTCSGGGGGSAQVFHTDYVCTGASHEEEVRARQAFPSGHATFAGFAAVFLILYGQARLQPRYLFNHLFVLRPLFQVFCLAVSLWVSVSRVADYVHHLEDVLAGYAMGATIGIVLAIQTVQWLDTLYQQNGAQNVVDTTADAAVELRRGNSVELKSATSAGIIVDSIACTPTKNTNHVVDKDVEKGTEEEEHTAGTF